MSEHSSAYETRSVSFLNEEMTVEQALQKTIRASQDSLNNLEVALRHLAAAEEQQLEEEDFRDMAVKVAEIEDFVEGFCDLLEELPEVAKEILGDCPKSQKAWYADFKVNRRAEKAAKKEQNKRDAAAAKLAAKEKLAVVKE